MKEVGNTSREWLILIALAVWLMPLSSSLTISPLQNNLSHYAGPQELVITFYNDEFKPLKLHLAPEPSSHYLSPFVSFDKDEFIIQAQEQVNVQIFTNFPEDLPPQWHHYSLMPNLEEDQRYVLSFRPPGTARPLLQVTDVTSQVGESLLLDMTLRNIGNVYLTVTPMLALRDELALVQNITYPSPLTLAPQQEYPLTLRHDLTSLPSGNYMAILKAGYAVDGFSAVTGEQVISFSWTPAEQEASEAAEYSWFMAIGLGIFILLISLIWFRKKSIDITSADVKELKRQKDHLKKELSRITRETGTLMEEIKVWKTGRL